MGFALGEPYDLVTLTMVDKPGVTIINDSIYELPSAPDKNVAGVVLLSVLRRTGMKGGFHITIKKNIMPGSGIGSSAASAAGAAVAANLLLGNIFSKEELVELAMEGEVVASGSKHADNLAPCIYGGVTLVRSIEPVDVIPIPAADAFVTIVHPQIEIKTSFARSILRPELPLKEAIRQWGNVGALVAGFYRNDIELIGRSMEDLVAEPYRKKLIPGFDEAKEASLNAGAIGGGISGSGPSLFMFSKDEATAHAVAAAMSKVYTDLRIEHHTYVTTISREGVCALKSEVAAP